MHIRMEVIGRNLLQFLAVFFDVTWKFEFPSHIVELHDECTVSPSELIFHFDIPSPPTLHCWLRIKRYVDKAENGKVKASPEVIKLWGTPSGRSQAIIWFL